ncbi:hypothetical protein F5B22DRAFT_647562 [Xylaria bambusicola]|uniref:uncharacterized protein n=1 Tax=Xylaria bambusicola TaxID=326684 RepID=UPI002007DCD7|nr:uncharacterized protein F5B22DRAFT_647562 [Xylaria bambusicola]KAI0514522.1 hypothetical protein F5B22DRAFT_647562 [Xylaria bambusicola]
MSTIINSEESGPVDTTQAGTASHTRALYDTGAKLFTKYTMAWVANELRLCEEDMSSGLERRIATLPRIDGSFKELDISLVPPTPSHDKERPGDSHCVIDYVGIERLAYDGDNEDLQCTDPYFPMTIEVTTRTNPDGGANEHDNDHDKNKHVSSVDGLCGVFSGIRRVWIRREFCNELRAVLNAVKPPAVLNKIFGVALGSLCAGTKLQHRAIYQHALIPTIQSILLQRRVVSVSCKRYVQDPAYTQRDKDVLSHQGLEVLDDPHAFLALDGSSVLVSICPTISVKQIVADICRPGIIIWARFPYQLMDDDRTFFLADEEPSRVTEMLENDYCEFDFPYHEYIEAPFGIAIYVRKGA